MFGILSHPATVHIPLALAILLPLGYPLAWLSVARGWMPEHIWTVFGGLFLIHLFTSVLSFVTGISAKVMSAAEPALILQHENLGKLFCLVALLLLIFELTMLRSKDRREGVWMHALVMSLLLAQGGLAIWLGRIGGKIVFG